MRALVITTSAVGLLLLFVTILQGQADAYRCGYLNAVREVNPANPADRYCIAMRALSEHFGGESE